MEQATFDDFMKLDIRVGTIVEARPLKRPAGPPISCWWTWARSWGRSAPAPRSPSSIPLEELVGKQVLAVVNFPPRQIANFFSQVLVLGTYSQGGVVLITPDKPVENGDRLG